MITVQEHVSQAFLYHRKTIALINEHGTCAGYICNIGQQKR